MRTVLVMLAALALTGCGTPAPTLLSANPVHYLVTLDQLASPDFTVLDQAAAVEPGDITGVDAALAAKAHADGWKAGAAVRFFRSVPLDTANGPLDIIAVTATFSSADGAHAWFADLRAGRAAVSGAESVSAGTLGDEAGATTTTASAPDGTPAVQITLVWRLGNVVNAVFVRGRYGGTRLDDALYVARQQTANELSG